MTLLQSFRDVFTLTHKDLLNLEAPLYQHKIHLKSNAKPVQQRRYRMNPNNAERFQVELDRLLGAGFTGPFKSVSWLRVVPKKNFQLCVYVDYRKLNAQIVDDHFALLFADTILNTVAGYKLYTFLDGLSGYNQVQVALEDQRKQTSPWS